MKALGLRHMALRVKSAQISKDFYTRHFGMSVEWEPDSKSVYLTTESQDNLALHEVEFEKSPQMGLDHFGFFFLDEDSVLKVYQNLKNDDVKILKEPKKHRDGAFSFYCEDPDGYVVQVLCHPPLVKKYSS